MDEYENVKKAFDEYFDTFKLSNKRMVLKYKHCYKVANLMEELAKRLGLSKEDIALAKIIGLLHDVGRFEQLKQIESFNDDKFDHADFAVEYLFKDKHIRDFLKDSSYDEIIAKSILYHNKYSLPSNLSDRELLFCKMIKDMDKTDIYYQVGINFQPKFVDKVTDKVLEDFNNKKLIERKYKKNGSDEVVNMMSFLYDYYFDESLDILVETDNLGLYLSTVEVSEENEELFKNLVGQCYKKINDGVNN